MIELSETRRIGGKTIVAVISFTTEDFEAQVDQKLVLFEAYEKLLTALDEAEVDHQLKSIINIPIE